MAQHDCLTARLEACVCINFNYTLKLVSNHVSPLWNLKFQSRALTKSAQTLVLWQRNSLLYSFHMICLRLCWRLGTFRWQFVAHGLCLVFVCSKLCYQIYMHLYILALISWGELSLKLAIYGIENKLKILSAYLYIFWEYPVKFLK